MQINGLSNVFTVLVVALAVGACEGLDDLLDPEPDQMTTADVFVIGTGDVVGTSKLIRNDNGVSMTFHTSGLEPGTVATVWWVIFHHPSACDADCGAKDLPNPAVGGTAFFAAGNVVKESGEADYWASLPVGLLTVGADAEANQIIAGDGILEDARGAEIHLVLRTHGEPIPDLIGHQLTTFDAGCTTAPPALQGPNTCMNLQGSIHQ